LTVKELIDRLQQIVDIGDAENTTEVFLQTAPNSPSNYIEGDIEDVVAYEPELDLPAHVAIRFKVGSE